jgi:hypothetical protein
MAAEGGTTGPRSLATITRLSEFELAVRDVTELIEGAPTNVGYWLWRGMARVALAQSIELQGAKARGVTVHVSSTLPPDMDGLLGLSFLARFEMKLDAKAGRLELSEHKPR